MTSPTTPPAAPSVALKPPNQMPGTILNEQIAVFFGYMTLVVLCLIALIRLPSFIKYRLRPIARPASFKSKGFLLSQTRDETAPTQESKEAQPSPGTSLFLKAKFALLKLCNRKVPLNGSPLGYFNLGNCVVFLLYLIILIVLSLYRNVEGTRSTMNYKRFGLLAISQFPLLFVLSMKNSPLNYITGVGYERLNFIHRTVGRMIFALAIIHGALQLKLQKDMTGQIHFKKASRYGLIALCILALLNLMGARFFRNCLYQVFLAIHILGYLTLIAILWLHSEHTRPFLKASIAFLAFDNLLKILKSKFKRATFTAMPGGLTRIQVQGVNDGWRAGQHVFIRVLKGRQIFEKHPFTIANAPNSSTPYGSTDHLLIVAKAAGDYTQRIHSLAGQAREISPDEKGIETNISFSQTKNEPKGCTMTMHGALSSSNTSYHVLVDGPYGTFFTDMTRYRTVLLCAGGSGFTYCMAALEDIVGQAAKCGHGLTKHIHVVWSLRDPDMIESFGPGLEQTVRVAEAHGISVTMKFFLTKANSHSMVERSYLTLIEFSTVRPDFSDLLNGVVLDGASASGGGLGVGVCGPTGMVETVSQAVTNLDPGRVQQIGGVELHTEKFGW